MTDADAPPGLGRATAIQAVGTLLSRVTGFGRFFALAYALHATRLADTYLLANNTPNIIYEVVLGGVLSGTVLPVFVRALRDQDGEDGGWRAVSAVMTAAVVGSAVLAVAFLAVAPLLIRLYTVRNSGEVASDQFAVATALLRLFAPQVFFYGVISVSTALLRARRRFAAPMFAPILNNFIVIGLFVAYPHVVHTRSLHAVRSNTGAILLLGLGTTAGVAAMALAQLPVRTIRDHVRWLWDPRHPAVRTIIRLSGWTVAFVIANQMALFLVNFLANGHAGDVTVYFFAFTIFLLPHGIISVSIISTIQPDLADRWAADDREGFSAQLSVGLRSILAVLVPAATGYVLLARPIIAVLLEHGAFKAAGAARVSGTLALMALGLPAYSGWLFLTATYQALQDTRSLFLLYLVENGINIVAAVVLYPALGVQGLGLAYALAYIGGTATALVDLRRRLGAIDGRGLARSATRVAGATAVMALVVGVMVHFIGSNHGRGAFLRVGVATAAGVTVYAAAARIFGVRELRVLMAVRRRR